MDVNASTYSQESLFVSYLCDGYFWLPTWYNLESFGKRHIEELYDNGWLMDMLSKIFWGGDWVEAMWSECGHHHQSVACAWTMGEWGRTKNKHKHARAHSFFSLLLTVDGTSSCLASPTTMGCDLEYELRKLFPKLFSSECLIAAAETELRHRENKVLSNQWASLLNNTYFEV